MTIRLTIPSLFNHDCHHGEQAAPIVVFGLSMKTAAGLFWYLFPHVHTLSLVIHQEPRKRTPLSLSSDQPARRASFLVGSCATVAVGLVTAFGAPIPCQAKEWNLPNGHVKLEDVSVTRSGRRLSNPQLIGSGGGGAVFAFDANEPAQSGGPSPLPTLVKVSWLHSAASVRQECSIMKYLNERKVSGVERCLALAAYPDDPRRVIMVKEPYFPETVESIAGLDLPEKQVKATRQVVRTMVQMMAANVATTDVQMLISTDGDVLFIDLTEARLLQRPWSDLDVALSRSFVSEMMALIPDQLHLLAKEEIREQMSRMHAEWGDDRTQPPDDASNNLRSLLEQLSFV